MMDLIVLGLATYRLARFFVFEDGPLHAAKVLREKAASVPVLGDALACIYCLSVWVAVALCAVDILLGQVWLLPFAVSAISVLLHEAIEALKAVGVVAPVAPVAPDFSVEEMEPSES